MQYLWALILPIFLCLFFVSSTSSQTELSNVNNLPFAQKLLDQYGYNGVINVTQLAGLIETIREANGWSKTEDGDLDKDDSANQLDQLKVNVNASDGIRRNESICSPGSTGYPQCLSTSNVCMSAQDIFNLHGVSYTTGANATQLDTMSPTILYNLQQPDCSSDSIDHHVGKHKPKPEELWGYSFLCVTLINLCSLLGMVFIPFMDKPFYNHVLLFMVALAVGTLAGSSILFLIPEAYDLTGEESHLGPVYMWRATTVMGGIYMFFLTERILKIITQWKQKRQKVNKREEDQLHGSVKTHHRHRDDSLSVSFKPGSGDMENVYDAIHQNTSSMGLISAKESEEGIEESNGHKNDKVANGVVAHTEKTEIKAVAWMVVFGDGIHNFIDGLSIGAAFTESTLTGLSVSLAVICEELPHELGDFAILLNSGMSMKQALSYNFLSACMCYLGTLLGILVGEMTSGARWVFALAGGMFLYISLVDMFPEVHVAAEEEEKKSGRTWFLFLLQNAGLLTGYGIMIILRYYGDMIDFDS